VDISGSNFPRFDINPNAGDPLGTPHVVLPIVPRAG
jgi:hypothetical protein